MDVLRRWTIYVCPLCGSDDYDSTRDDSKCGNCGEWMNVEPVEVVPTEDDDRRTYYCTGVVPERSPEYPVRVVLGTAWDRQSGQLAGAVELVEQARGCVTEALNLTAHSWHGSDQARKWLMDAHRLTGGR